MSNLEKLKEKLKIDEHALEIAIREHPELVYDVGMELANAISQRDFAKQEFEEVEALVDADLRRQAAISEEKTTETQIASNKKLNPKVKDASRKFQELKLKADQWGVLKESFNQRSYALSKLVDLYLANYYSNIEKSGTSEFKTVQADRIKQELKSRRVKV
ncbi:MAG: hypothetical protein KGI08_10940 [Thaumarchaeota archaeon]|nr:hypothetical protein [Nitrososphaerota archaeon]